ncbi:MAG: penicillin-binding protein 2 [Parcubacteria group bacterium]|nr:penicillin-binding protein 2 [Parcubacteria group bacterium]
MAGVALLAIVIIGRLAYLQILNQGFYKALAQGQQNLSSLAKGERGQIFVKDKEGALYQLATIRKIPFVFISPVEIEDREQAALLLSSTLLIPESEIIKKMDEEESLYELILKNVSSEQAQSITKARVKGVYVGEDAVRFYPQGSLAAHVLGFTNQEGKGQYGVEEYYNSFLEGKEGIATASPNPGGYLFSSQDTVQDGSDVILTLDLRIQTKAEELLKKAVADLEAKEGSIVVMDPASGKILAMASTPDFDPNAFGSVSNLERFQNPVIEKLFEPGSVFKPLTMAGAIEKGKVTPDTTYQDQGMLERGGEIIRNYDNRSYGVQTMRQVLEFSINTGAVFAEEQLGHQNFLDFIKRFGIFEQTGIDLAGETYSANQELKKGHIVSFATAAFGQGVEMNPLQILRAFSAIANKGMMVNPVIAETILERGTEIVPKSHARQQIRVMSEETAATVTSMLASVVEEGFGKRARIPGYHIAGKTGTAQVAYSALGIAKPGYSQETVQSFIGYAPAFNPRFMLMVKINNPKTRTAEYSAIPVFHDLAKYIIDYYQIPPDITNVTE